MTDNSTVPKATVHPCAGRSAAQRQAFERIAVSMPHGASRRTLDTLVRAGLIEYAGEAYAGRDAFGVFSVKVYAVPLPVHMQWCQWCAENVEEATDA